MKIMKHAVAVRAWISWHYQVIKSYDQSIIINLRGLLDDGHFAVSPKLLDAEASWCAWQNRRKPIENAGVGLRMRAVGKIERPTRGNPRDYCTA